MENNVEIKHKKKNVKLNYIYNLTYQLLLIIVPLFVTPYISRVLLADGIGKYSFSYSIITYFTIFASLGYGNYAQREIARSKDEHVQSIRFWEIVICRFLSVIISLLINYILCMFGAYGSYTTLLLILGINILSVGFDISFYFQGREEFSKIVLVNFITKIVGIVSIFLFVKTKNDLWKYTLINVSMLFFGYLFLWIYLPKTLKKVSKSELHPLRHLKGSIILFIPAIATTIYTVLDKTLIGLLVSGTYVEVEDGVEVVKKISDLENGYYEQSEKISKLLLTIITCLGTVMIPRNSKEFASGNVEKVKENVYMTSRIVWLIGIPMSLGLVIISPYLVPLFFGEGYDKCITLISILGFLILAIGFSNVFGVQYLLPSGQDKKFTISLTVGALINFSLNIVFIKLWMSIGAAIATIIAETCVTIVMMILIHKEIKIGKILLSSWKYLIAGIIMFISLFFLKKFLDVSIINTIILVISGILIYFIVLLVLVDSLVIDLIKKSFRFIKVKIFKKNV